MAHARPGTSVGRKAPFYGFSHTIVSNKIESRARQIMIQRQRHGRVVRDSGFVSNVLTVGETHPANPFVQHRLHIPFAKLLFEGTRMETLRILGDPWFDSGWALDMQEIVDR